MNGRLRALAAQFGGTFTRKAALECGYNDDTIYRNLRAGHWRKVRHGVYAESALYDGCSAAERHLLLIRSVQVRCASDLVISHASAAIAHGWPTWNVPLDTVCATRAGAISGRSEAGVHHFRAELPPDQVEVIDGIRVTSKERTMVDAVRHYGMEEAIVICDAALADGADPALAREILSTCFQWPMARGAPLTLAFADGRSQSVGESRLRVRFHWLGLPAMRPQGRLYAPDGRLVAIVDLLCEGYFTAFEFDGKVKYGIDGNDPREQLFKEKRREDDIRQDAAHELARYVWPELDDLSLLPLEPSNAPHDAAASRSPTSPFSHPPLDRRPIDHENVISPGFARQICRAKPGDITFS